MKHIINRWGEIRKTHRHPRGAEGLSGRETLPGGRVTPVFDCGEPAEDWSTVDPASEDVLVRFQPRCRKCHRYYDGAVDGGNHLAKLTDEKVREWRARRADGMTYRQLAVEFGISDVSACAAGNRKTWAHVV